MPDLSGVQTAQAIRLQAGYSLPVIIVSTYDWINTKKGAMEAGINRLVQRSFFKFALYHCIRRHVLHKGGYPRRQNDRVSLAGRRILIVEDNGLNREIPPELLMNASV